MLWLGLDFETTGLDPKECTVTEIGAVLWDTELGLPVKMLNVLLNYDVEIPEFITGLTGITKPMLDKYGEVPHLGWAQLGDLVKECDYIMAHNAPFDKSFYDAAKEAYGGSSEEVPFPEKPWIDTSKDVPYREDIKTRKLVYLAAEHDFLNPFAHRAVFDVLTMLKVVSEYDPITVVNWAKSPTKTIRAVVTFDDKHLAKERGYRWNKDKKWWVKEVKEFQLETEKAESPFEIMEIQL